MPTFNEANVRHLLRRTEFTDRPDRVAHLLTLGSIEAAVDDVMNVPANPPSASFAGVPDETWRRGLRLAEHWMDQMAITERSFGERMAFFWHGHICSELSKIGSAPAMQEQIDLFRSRGLGPASNGGDVTELAKTMSVQVAMLKYLDNDQNFATSPNQNFARELMELFLLGVGNYTEADVEAATAAWTGHTRPRWDIDEYVFEADRHEANPQQFLGRTINDSRPGIEAGEETIEVILGTGPLGSGVIPAGAEKNQGRPAAEVAAEFLTYKLWQEFGEAESRTVPSGVQSVMTSALLTNGFAIRPWVRAMLVHNDFYASATKNGLVRQPVEYVVALLSALGLDAEDAAQLWLMDRTGQRPLYPPNVSGWKPNGYWVNASAMGARQQLLQGCVWVLTRDTWDGDDGYIQFGDNPAHRLTRLEVNGRWQDGTEPIPDAEFVDRLIAYTGLQPPASTRSRILAHLAHPDIESWMRLDAILLLLSAPEMHIA